LALEEASFTSDRLNRRRLRHWLGAANAILLVAESTTGLAGYSLALTRADSKAARLYSIAIASGARGLGLGERLLRRTEQECSKRGCTALRLEVAAGNRPALALYEKLRYRPFARIPGYYEDGQDA